MKNHLHDNTRTGDMGHPAACIGSAHSDVLALMKTRFALSLLALPALALAQVKLTQSPDKISVEIDGKPFSDFFIGKDARKPYLHPLRTADGKIITRHYPMENVKGESHDHPHHRGLWFTHGDVNGLDFWSNEPDQKGAKIKEN